jgi:glucosamine kinase
MTDQSLVELPESLLHPPTEGDARYVLGVDGGATKTLAAILDLETRTLQLALGGPSNEDAVGTNAAVNAVLGAADEAIERAGIEADELGSAVLAIAGTDTGAIAAHVLLARSADWIVVNDVVGAWATATGGGPGVAAISGTGSNVFGVGPDGRAWRAGGWGHLLGDQGSGYWIGLESIMAALRDRDASGPNTALSQAAPAFFEMPNIEALAVYVYSKPLSKAEIAAFAIETARLAEEGDAVALEIYERGANQLSAQLAAVIRRTGLASGAGDDGLPPAFPVGLIGSAFRAGAVFVEPLVQAVYAIAPRARLSVVDMPPVGGSLLLAARACGRGDAIDAGELSQLIDSALAQIA